MSSRAPSGLIKPSAPSPNVIVYRPETRNMSRARLRLYVLEWNLFQPPHITVRRQRRIRYPVVCVLIQRVSPESFVADVVAPRLVHTRIGVLPVPVGAGENLARIPHGSDGAVDALP